MMKELCFLMGNFLEDTHDELELVLGNRYGLDNVWLLALRFRLRLCSLERQSETAQTQQLCALSTWPKEGAADVVGR